MASLTLITSVLNGLPFLDAMLASAPRRAEVEHLVIDAGSTDGTLERLRQQPGLRLMSRPGMSQYAAWNEAVRMASSPHVTFLNADDELPASALDTMLSRLAELGGADILCGEAEAFSDHADGAKKLRHYAGDALAGLNLPVLTFGAAIINAKLFRRELILEAGGFDETFTFAADREFLLRLLLRHSGLEWRLVPALFYRYRVHAGSATLRQLPLRRVEIAREHHEIAERCAALTGIDPEARQLFRRWRAHEDAVMLVRGLRAQDLGAARTAAGALARLLVRVPRTILDLTNASAIRKRNRAAHAAAYEQAALERPEVS